MKNFFFSKCNCSRPLFGPLWSSDPASKVPTQTHSWLHTPSTQTICHSIWSVTAAKNNHTHTDRQSYETFWQATGTKPGTLKEKLGSGNVTVNCLHRIFGMFCVTHRMCVGYCCSLIATHFGFLLSHETTISPHTD